MRSKAILTIILTVISFLTSIGTATAQEIERSWKDRLTTYITETYRISNASLIVDIVLDISESRKIEPTLVLAMIHVESGFNHKARNPSGAKGLMQVMTPLHNNRFTNRNLVYDPQSNIEVGVEIWKECEERSRNFNQTAKCYSGGSQTWATKVKKQQKVFEKFDIIKEL